MTGLRSGSVLDPSARLLPERRGRIWRLLGLLLALVLVLALLLALLLAGLGWVGRHLLAGAGDDGTLDDRTLVGPRGPACVRLVVGLDTSGSMVDFAGPRDAALAQLLGWSGRNLRADDEIAVVAFAAEAVVRMPPTPVAALGPAGSAVSPADGRFTYLGPILRALDEFPPSACDTDLLLMSDAQLADLPADSGAGRALLADHEVHDIRLLAPGEGIEVPPQWAGAFPGAAPERFDGSDPDDTAVAIGRTVARLTGQSLS